MFIANNKKNVLVSNKIHAGVLALLEQHFNVVVNPESEPFSPDEYSQLLADADALLAFMTDRVDEAFLNQAPRLKMVSAALKGFDNFDLQLMQERKIHFCHVPDLLSEPTAELALTLTLSLLRNLMPGHALVKSGGFAGWRPILYSQSLHRARVGILGMGGVAKALVPLLRGFECEIFYHDIQRLAPETEAQLGIEFREAKQIHRDVDVFYPLLSLTESTYHWLDQEALLEMMPGAVVVNVGRGSIVDEAAITHALENKHLGGYAADVFEMEDWAVKSRPRSIRSELLSQHNTIFTPHLGSAVAAVRYEIELSAARKIIDFFASETLT